MAFCCCCCCSPLPNIFIPHFFAAAVAAPNEMGPCGLSSELVEDIVIDLVKVSNVPRRRDLALPIDVVEELRSTFFGYTDELFVW